jgi:hypothetical protein
MQLRHLATLAVVMTALTTMLRGSDDPSDHRLVVSRIQYDGNTFGSSETFPNIFTDPKVTGIQGPIFLDEYRISEGGSRARRVHTLPLTGITTSFSSKSEGALMRSVDGAFLTYMGYDGPVGANGVSNSYTTGANLPGNSNPLFDRVVALIDEDGAVTLYLQANAYSGDNPRAAITVDGAELYMAGNADSTIDKSGVGPGTTIGARYDAPGTPTSYQLGKYFAVDRPDETTKQHVKDNNFRGIGIYGGNLYVSKGSGGNGDDGIFQVHKGIGNGLPTGTTNTITMLLGAPATDPATGNPSPLTPFGFWFANATTLYVADEGYANFDVKGHFIPDPQAGLQKWSLRQDAWQLDYILRDGLELYEPESVHHYPTPTYTTGLRNMTGVVNPNGTVTIYAITSQWSTVSNGEPDPTKLVTVTDELAATTLPTHHADGDDDSGKTWDDRERFKTLRVSAAGEVFRGVAFAPCTLGHHDSCESSRDRVPR